VRRRRMPHPSSSSPITRLSIAVSTCVLAFAGVLVATTGTAQASSAGAFVSDTNSARASHGLSSYSVASDLTSIAQQHAAWMARNGSLSHNSSLGSDVCCWRSIGENVGEGSSESQVQNAFMNSSAHRANILSSAFTQIGVGTATDSHGTLWVDEVFRQPMGSSGSHRIVTHTHRATSSQQASTSRRTTVRRPAAPNVNLLVLLARRLHQAAAGRGHPRDPVAAAVGFTRVMAQVQR
jgi:uncharacterized protein YkwD